MLKPSLSGLPLQRSRATKGLWPGGWRKRKGIAKVRLEDGATRLAEVHWYEAHGIGRKIQDQALHRLDHESIGKHFAGLSKNKGYEVSLERRKIYQFPDPEAAKHRQFESSTSQAKTTISTQLFRAIELHNLYAEPFGAV